MTSTRSFSVETQSLMSTIIHSLYSKKDYAIRELISNASDALTKFSAEYHSIRESFPNALTHKPSDLRITVTLVDDRLTITDNGIGMSEQDLDDLLGTIASSGTKRWKQAMQDKSFESNSASLIGQFGLGFYSAFLVSDYVQVITKKVGFDAVVWTCSGFGSYEISKYEGEDVEELLHGTSVVLKIRESDGKYKDAKKVEEIIKTYSNFIPHPIYIMKVVEEEVIEEGDHPPCGEEKFETVKVEEITENDITNDNNATTDNNNETDNNNNATDNNLTDITPTNDEDEPVITENNTSNKVTKKMVTKQFLINKEKPLWTKKPKDCTPEEYTSFYKALSNDWEDFLTVKHCSLEGMINLTLLLFIPKRSQTSMFEKQKKDNVKLYVQNVLVTDDLKDAVPDWMSFIVGVINSDDAPMNVSREMLQGTNTYKMIKNNLSKKVIEAIEDLSEDKEKYEIFLKNFSANLKMAVRDSTGKQQEKTAKLLRYYSSKSTEERISLDDYLERNKENKAIYVLTGLTKEEVMKSPFLSLYKNNEVLFMYDTVDEIMLQGFNKYKEIDLKRITSEGCSELGKIENIVEEDFKDFNIALKEELSNFVEKITLKNLGDCPCVVSSAAYSHSAAMENIIRSQPGADSNPFLMMMGRNKKILEINPEHEVINSIKKMFNKKDEAWKKYANLLYNTALIECGYKLDDGVVYAKKVFDFLKDHLNKNEVVVEEVAENNVEVL